MIENDPGVLMRTHLPAEFHADVGLSVREAMHLRHASVDDEVIGYFGGLPELPDEMDWPGASHGHYEHVATIDLAKVPSLDLNLPTAGRFVVFGDTDGWEGAFHYFPEGTTLRERALPADLAAHDRVFVRTDMSCVRVPTIPTTEFLTGNLVDDDHYDDEELYERFESFVDAGPRWRHQLGGWANEIQGDNDGGLLPGTPAAQRFSPGGSPAGQVLIAQFGTDHALRMGWGDFGKLYCFIPVADLLARDFTRVRTYWECH